MHLFIFWNSLFPFCCLENMNEIAQWFYLSSVGIPSWWLITALQFQWNYEGFKKYWTSLNVFTVVFCLIFQCFCLHFTCFCFSRITPVSLFICLSRATLKQTILEKNSWIMLLIMIFLGSHALKILFVHMYIHTARILSPSQGKEKSPKMLKPFVQRKLLCFLSLQQYDFSADLSVSTKEPHFITVAVTVPCSPASRRKFLQAASERFGEKHFPKQILIHL